MSALAAAFFTAAIALLGKIAFDIWGDHKARRMVASALAGEIAAYVSFYTDTDVPASFRAIAEIEREKRVVRLRAMNSTPSGHPVFDKLSDKLGLLRVSDVFEISVFYNVVSGFRLMFNNLSSDRFLSADEEFQKAMLYKMADSVAVYIPRATRLVEELNARSTESFPEILRNQFHPYIAQKQKTEKEIKYSE